MDEPYRVEVLHIVNPHLIFIESKALKGEPVIQQVGIYGVLPVYKTIDIDGEIIAERCENWPIAANTILREFFADLKHHVYFVPIHDEQRSTIFDENIHQFGDLLIKHEITLSITDHLIDFAIAVKDEATFHQKLSSGSLKLKLNTARAEEVLKAIEKFYKKQRSVNHDWEKTIKNQTSLHQETVKINTLTKENLKLLDRSSRAADVEEVMKLIAQKEKDLNLCKGDDLVPLGRGSKHSSSRPTLSKPEISDKHHEMFDNFKQLLLAQGRKKNDDVSQHQLKESIKHSTPKTLQITTQISKLPPLKYDKSLSIDDEEWDDIENISKTQNTEQLNTNQNNNYSSKVQQEQLEHNKNVQHHKSGLSRLSGSQNQEYVPEIPQQILTSNVEVNSDQIAAENYQSKSNRKSDSGAYEKNSSQNIFNHEKEQDIKHNMNNDIKNKSQKPKERHVVYCPDMEMNTSNLKNFVTIKLTENCAANFANTIEVPGNKTLDGNDNECKMVVKDSHNDIDLSVCKKDVKDAFDDDANVRIRDVEIGHNVNSNSYKKAKVAHVDSHKSQSSEVTSKAIADTDKGSKLNTAYLEKKLLALKNLRNNDDTNSVTSNSDISYIKKGNSVATKTKSYEVKNDLGNELGIVSRFETKSSINSRRTRVLSSSILQKKWQAHKDLQKRNENSDSTSDTSVKDSDSSTEQSKSGADELDRCKIQPEPLEVKSQPIPIENVNKVARNVNPFKNIDGSKSIFVEKLVSPSLMVHTKNNNLIVPQCEIRDVPFKPNIKMMLKNMRIQKPKRLQTVTWPYILRGHSMFIIGPAGNGKTVGYVPAVCNLLLDSSKSEGVGPICIVVCATSLSVSEVEGYCKKFLSVEERIVTFYPGIDHTKTTTALLNGCHVLICTAPALLGLLETDFGVDLRRLKMLVLDDCERLAQVYTTELTRIIHNVKVMLKNRADKALKVQYVVASRQWCDFMTPLAKKAPDTVIAIGASQECVLYSKTKTSVNFVKSQDHKVNTVVEFLGEIDRTKRIVIVCREDEEVTSLSKTLKTQNHVVFSCNSTMDLHELCELNEIWASYEEPILGPILICCDGNLTHLNITNANYLIHFSMPPLFSMFCKRFLVLNDNYSSIFGPERDDVKIKILLDETNVEQLPKIIHFVKRCTKETLANLNNALQEVVEAKDLKKAQNLNPICNTLLMLGECVDMWNCQDRHTVFKEYDEPKDWIPKQGLITFKITHYDTAVTYSARVLTKVTKSGTEKYPNNYNTLSLKMGMHYSKETNRKMHGVPKVGDVCAVALKQNFFERCRVMKVIPSDTKNTNHVLINLIDEEQMTIVSDVLLYYLPDQFKAIETYVVKVRLANIQPKDRDVTFSLVAKDLLQQKTESDREHGLYMRGQVVMTLGNTIFVDTAEACVDLSSLNETVVKRDFKKDLLDCHAEPNFQHITKLKKIAGISNTIDVNEPKVVKKVKRTPKWAHLDKDDFSAVILAAVIDAGTIFLRHAKFQKVIDLLLKDIKEYVEKAPEIDRDEINVGNVVLAELPDDDTYERARIDGIVNDNTVNCFFVDNGDWRHVSVNKLKPITDKLIHRIPFQAIECRLVGVKPPGNADAWPEFSTCWLDDNCFEDKEGNSKQLFVKYFTKEAATITGGHKYGVVIVDTYAEEDVIVNKMMIELNLAKVVDDEEKYIEEPFNLKVIKVADSSSDISDEFAEKDNSAMDENTPIIKDLVPVQPKESEVSENNDIPLNVLLGKPIRSVPLVNSDSDSDILDKWDVNVDKDLLGMFGQPSKANITEQSDTNDRKNKVEFVGHSNIPKKTNDVVDSTKTAAQLDIVSDSNKNEKTKHSSINSDISSVLLKIDSDDKRSQSMSPSLDSDDIDIDDDRMKALNIFRRKISAGNITYLNQDDSNTEKKIEEKSKDDTLDSDDLSTVATQTSIPKASETEPPRKPKLVWRQNKTFVAVKINLIGVESYTLEIKERQIKFISWHNDVKYEFELELYGVIVPKKSAHANKGQYIQVRLVKLLPRNWLSLTKDLSVKKWIVYDVDAIEFISDDDDEDYEEARKAIKQNHEKAESSSDEEFVDDMNFKYKRH